MKLRNSMGDKEANRGSVIIVRGTRKQTEGRSDTETETDRKRRVNTRASLYSFAGVSELGKEAESEVVMH